MNEGDEIGPLQLMVVGFEDPRFSGGILQEVKKLSDQNLIKVIDAVAVYKDVGGKVEVREMSDLQEGEAEKYGAYIGLLIGIGTGDEAVAEDLAKHEALRFQARYRYGLSKEALGEIADTIPEGGAALTVLLEHRWAMPLRNAMRDAGGFLLAQDFLSPELLMLLGNELHEGTKEKTQKEKLKVF